MARRALFAVVAAVALLVLPAVALAAGDPYRGQQWSLDRIGAPDAWQVSRGGGVVVAVVDTGVTLDHPDLVDRFLRDASGQIVGHDVLDGGAPDDPHGHGTLVAGVIAATEGNGEGIAGVAPAVSIMPVRVLADTGEGRGRDVDAGIRWAVDHGADVINLSLESVPAADGSSSGPGAPTEAVAYAWERGVAVVAAVGNSGGHLDDYPPDSPVVLVGATDRDDRPASFSSEAGSDVVYAPGVDIVSTWCRPPGGGRCAPGSHSYGLAEGTSFAAPHVTGVLALLRGAGLSAEQAVVRLRQSARQAGTAEHGQTVPVVDAAAALGVTGSQAAAATQQPVPAAPAPKPPAAPTPAGPAGRSSPHQSPAPIADPPTPAPPSVAAPPEAVAGVADRPLLLDLLAAALVGGALATWSLVSRSG